LCITCRPRNLGFGQERKIDQDKKVVKSDRSDLIWAISRAIDPEIDQIALDIALDIAQTFSERYQERSHERSILRSIRSLLGSLLRSLLRSLLEFALDAIFCVIESVAVSVELPQMSMVASCQRFRGPRNTWCFNKMEYIAEEEEESCFQLVGRRDVTWHLIGQTGNHWIGGDGWYLLLFDKRAVYTWGSKPGALLHLHISRFFCLK